MAILSEDTGVLVFPPYYDLASDRLNLSHREADAKLLFFLSYFEKVGVVPLNLALPLGILPGSTMLEQTLFQQKVIAKLDLVNVQQKGEWNQDFIAEQVRRAYVGMNNGERGHWAVASPEGTLREFRSQAINTIVVTLERCLPCPRDDVPPNEVIGFRVEHRAELDTLRRNLNRAFFSLGGASVEDANAIFEKDLAEALNQVQSSYKKRGIPVFFPDMEVSLQVPGEYVTAASEVIAQLFGAPMGVGGAVAAFVSANLGGFSLSPGGNQFPKDYSYVLKGLRRGVLESFPDREYSNDLDNVRIARNIARLGYPSDLAEPGGMRGGNYESNISM